MFDGATGTTGGVSGAGSGGGSGGAAGAPAAPREIPECDNLEGPAYEATSPEERDPSTPPRVDSTSECFHFHWETPNVYGDCLIVLPIPPVDLDYLNAVIDCDIVQRQREQGDGWVYDQTAGSIRFEGASCALLQDGSRHGVDVVYGCPGVTID